VTDNVEFRCGYEDAKNGHSPSLLGGRYMEGYKKGCVDTGRRVGIRIRPDVSLVEERDALRRKIEELRDPETCCGCGNPSTWANWVCRACR
jgi:hypothetical protein